MIMNEENLFEIFEGSNTFMHKYTFIRVLKNNYTYICVY